MQHGETQLRIVSPPELAYLWLLDDDVAAPASAAAAVAPAAAPAPMSRSRSGKKSWRPSGLVKISAS